MRDAHDCCASARPRVRTYGFDPSAYYQIVDVEPKRLKFRTFTASGKLYDGFDLERTADGNRLNEITEPTLAARTCSGEVGPDGGRCVASGK